PAGDRRRVRVDGSADAPGARRCGLATGTTVAAVVGPTAVGTVAGMAAAPGLRRDGTWPIGACPALLRRDVGRRDDGARLADHPHAVGARPGAGRGAAVDVGGGDRHVGSTPNEDAGGVAADPASDHGVLDLDALRRSGD